jgi:hypothetical protein
MDIAQAKHRLDGVLKKSRVHWYKPIQVAELLHRKRTVGELDLRNVDNYRARSREWRDEVCKVILGRCSTSSSRFQDNLFEDNAVPPEALVALASENDAHNGVVEAYVYVRFEDRMSHVQGAFTGLQNAVAEQLDIREMFSCFRSAPGLRRSIDKIYEVAAYVILSTYIARLQLEVTVSVTQPPGGFSAGDNRFLEAVVGVDGRTFRTRSQAGAVYRAGVTNAADRGLDMWANFGPVIQVKHLSLDQSLAEDIMEAAPGTEVVIVCTGLSPGTSHGELIQRYGGRLVGIITETDIVELYRTMISQGNTAAAELRDKLLTGLQAEFPVCNPTAFQQFMSSRGYRRDQLRNTPWEA